MSARFMARKVDSEPKQAKALIHKDKHFDHITKLSVTQVWKVE
jgi:hypothetical protein